MEDQIADSDDALLLELLRKAVNQPILESETSVSILFAREEAIQNTVRFVWKLAISRGGQRELLEKSVS